MHPTLVLVFWLCALVLLQRIPVAASLLVLSAGVLSCGAAVRSAGWRLVVRTRWLILVLVVTTSMMMPGESLWPGAPATAEGVVLAGEHLARLLSVLFAVAWLLDRLPASDLLEAIWGIADRTGLSGARRATVRLALTMQEIGSADPSRPLWREVAGLVQASSECAPNGDAPVVFRYPRIGAAGIATGAGAIFVTAIAWRALP